MVTLSPGERQYRQRKANNLIVERCQFCQSIGSLNDKRGVHTGPGSHVPVDIGSGLEIRADDLKVTDEGFGLQGRFA